MFVGGDGVSQLGKTEDHPFSTQECSPSRLFALLWATLSDAIGNHATAMLLRRSVRAARARRPELARLTIQRIGLQYRYSLPDHWHVESDEPLQALRELCAALQPLLMELTGSIVVEKLTAIPEFQRRRLMPAPSKGARA